MLKIDFFFNDLKYYKVFREGLNRRVEGLHTYIHHNTSSETDFKTKQNKDQQPALRITSTVKQNIKTNDKKRR